MPVRYRTRYAESLATKFLVVTNSTDVTSLNENVNIRQDGGCVKEIVEWLSFKSYSVDNSCPVVEFFLHRLAK